MELSQLHFAYPQWLWLGLMVPIVWVSYFLYAQNNQTHRDQLKKFIDAHLLDHLLLDVHSTKRPYWKALLTWSLAWLCLTVALAAPRWNMREVETFSRDQSLIVLLDLSESMNATDVKPSRLGRAKQKIEDLLKLSRDVKIGLIAFAADAHMIAPVTEDKEMLLQMLPSLDSDLVYIQGSRLSPALEMASKMLEQEPGNNHALLVISDGGFEDSSALMEASKLANRGVVIHAMGLGTTEGILLQNHHKNAPRQAIFSKLEKEKLCSLCNMGNGLYLEGHYSDHDAVAILNALEQRAEAKMNAEKKNEIWDESFYWMLLPVLIVMLTWFRKGAVL